MLISICIPTYNRPRSLENCLNSISISKKNIPNFNFEVCISDNSNDDLSEQVVNKYKKILHIKYNKNEKNLGFGINALKSINLASGEFSWMMGDDDLILPNTLSDLEDILNKNKDKDYFFINSFFLKTDFLEKFSHPFNSNNLDLEKMKSMSTLKKNLDLTFFQIINPQISWDFLIGIFFSVFRTKKWKESAYVINKNNLYDLRPWSNFDNTCLHPKVICSAFKDSKAFFCSKPLSVNLIGNREWASLYEFIEIVRIPELLDFYRSQGLSFWKYIYYKNFSLRNFSNYMMKIIIGGEKTGRHYLNFYQHIFKNLIYPNVYLSVFYYLFKKILKKKIN